MYTELPLIETSTPAERLAALKDAKELLSDTPGETKPAIFGGGSTSHVYAPDTAQMIRIAEYITTGHDYKDSHPEGKRRPIIKNIHVTVMAPGGQPEDLAHLLSHVEDGSFAEFIEDMIKNQPDPADAEKSADDN